MAVVVAAVVATVAAVAAARAALAVGPVAIGIMSARDSMANDRK